MYNYTKTPCSIDRLTYEIGLSSIVTALDYISSLGSDISIYFKATLSAEDETTLTALVAAHTGTPMPNNQVTNVAVTSQPSVTISASPPFGSKTVVIGGVTKKLYARTVGIQQALSIGSNTVDYTIPYPWVKIVGIEAINCEVLDQVDCKIIDTAAGTYSGIPNYTLNQFGYAVNMPKDFYTRTTQFDADLYQGMIVRITYTSISAKTVGINFLINELKT